MYLAEMEEEEEELENNFDEYHEVMAMTSRDSFRMMEDFAGQLSDSNPLRHRHFPAFSKRGHLPDLCRK